VDPFSTPRPDLGEGISVPAAGSSRPLHGRPLTHHPRRRLLTVLAAAAIAVGACSGAGPTPVAIPSNATASAVPPASATPASSPTPAPAATFPLTLTDDEGSAVALTAMPRKIVSLTPATTEILFAIGAGDRTVAKVEDITPYPPAADPLPVVAKFGSVDVEKIVSLGADLVIAGGNGFNPPAAIAQLRRANIPVLVVYAAKVDGVLSDIELVGDAVGAGPAARDLTASMRAGFDQVAALARSLPKPRTFYELDATKEIYGPAKDSFIAEMISLAGGEPVTTDDPAVFSIPLEKLVAADPEVIILGDAAYGTTTDIVTKRPGWDAMAAVKTGAIRPADDVVISRPGPRLVLGLIALAIAIHPELAGQLPGSSPAPSPAVSPSASEPY
jgi:iron complex transport system substrate-binding protein